MILAIAAAILLIAWLLFLRYCTVTLLAYQPPDVWHDCPKHLPYRDVNGRMIWLPFNTQRKMVGERWVYREHEENYDDWLSRSAW